MEDQKRYYSSRIEYDIPTSAKDIEPSDLLPEWVETLQQYFGKKHSTDDAQTYKNRSYFRKGKI